MHEDKFWESLTRGADVFRILVLICVISLIVFIVLRIVMPAVNDRRTRKILIEGMPDDGEDGAADGDGKKAARPPGNKKA